MQVINKIHKKELFVEVKIKIGPYSFANFKFETAKLNRMSDQELEEIIGLDPDLIKLLRQKQRDPYAEKTESQ